MYYVNKIEDNSVYITDTEDGKSVKVDKKDLVKLYKQGTMVNGVTFKQINKRKVEVDSIKVYHPEIKRDTKKNPFLSLGVDYEVENNRLIRLKYRYKEMPSCRLRLSDYAENIEADSISGDGIITLVLDKKLKFLDNKFTSNLAMLRFEIAKDCSEDIVNLIYKLYCSPQSVQCIQDENEERYFSHLFAIYMKYDTASYLGFASNLKQINDMFPEFPNKELEHYAREYIKSKKENFLSIESPVLKENSIATKMILENLTHISNLHNRCKDNIECVALIRDLCNERYYNYRGSAKFNMGNIASIVKKTNSIPVLIVIRCILLGVDDSEIVNWVFNFFGGIKVEEC